MALRILDWRFKGLPFLFPDFAALRARVDSEASVWKKWPGSVDRDMLRQFELVLEACSCSLVVKLCTGRARQGSTFRGRA